MHVDLQPGRRGGGLLADAVNLPTEASGGRTSCVQRCQFNRSRPACLSGSG